MAQPQTVGSVVVKISAAIFIRIVLNTARRFVYPFAPVIGRGLAAPLTSVTAIIAASQFLSLLGLVFGPLADRFGYHRMMGIGLAIMSLGMIAAGLHPVYALVAVAILAGAIAKAIFDPALQGYLGQVIAFDQRARFVGLLEMGWAGSSLIGIPLAAVMIDRMGWQSPFLIIGLLGLLGLTVLPKLVAGATGAARPSQPRSGSMWNWRWMLTDRAARGALVFAFLMSAANDNLFVIYGAWLEDAFELSVVGLGMGTLAIGAAELLGEILTAAIADRFGLDRSVIWGLTAAAVCYAILPFCSSALWLGLSGLFVLFLAFEFTIVSFLSICTELYPQKRATMVSGFLAASGLGRMTGALTGGVIWQSYGILGVGSISAAVSILAVVIFALTTSHAMHIRQR